MARTSVHNAVTEQVIACAQDRQTECRNGAHAAGKAQAMAAAFQRGEFLFEQAYIGVAKARIDVAVLLIERLAHVCNPIRAAAIHRRDHGAELIGGFFQHAGFKGDGGA